MTGIKGCLVPGYQSVWDREAHYTFQPGNKLKFITTLRKKVEAGQDEGLYTGSPQEYDGVSEKS